MAGMSAKGPYACPWNVPLHSTYLAQAGSAQGIPGHLSSCPELHKDKRITVQVI